MLPEDVLNRDVVLSTYVFSNTPSYLFRRLRREPSVKAVSDHSPTEQIVRGIERLTSKPERDAESIAYAYALLVALSYKQPEELARALGTANIEGLNWLPAIRDYISGLTPTVRATFSASTARALGSKPASSATLNELVVPASEDDA